MPQNYSIILRGLQGKLGRMGQINNYKFILSTTKNIPSSLIPFIYEVEDEKILYVSTYVRLAFNFKVTVVVDAIRKDEALYDEFEIPIEDVKKIERIDRKNPKIYKEG